MSRLTNISKLALVVIVCALTACMGSLFPFTEAHASATWTNTASLNAIAQEQLVLIDNGNVLAAGGDYNGAQSWSEVYYSGSWHWSANNMHTARLGFTLTKFYKSGSEREIAIGGINALYSATASADIYNPATDSWSVSGGIMAYARDHHTATLMNDGTILVTGGTGRDDAEIYTPSTDSFSSAGTFSDSKARANHAAVLLPDGSVFVAGGVTTGGTNILATQVYSPSLGTWTAGPTLNHGHNQPAIMTVLSGTSKVLIAGGYSTNTAEICDFSSGIPSSCTDTSTTMTATRTYATGVQLGNGKVLVAGGYSNLSSAELYDPSTDSWSSTGSMNTARYYSACVLMSNGNALVAGGSNGSVTYTGTSEYYTP